MAERTRPADQENYQKGDSQFASDPPNAILVDEIRPLLALRTLTASGQRVKSGPGLNKSDSNFFNNGIKFRPLW